MAPDNDRVILTKVTHPYNAFEPFFVLVLYAPANSGQQRQQFFDQVLNILHSPALGISLDRLFITGDFNYSYLRPHLSSQTSLQWVSFLDDYCYNALLKNGLHELPTFRRNDTIYSTIDYIFVSRSLSTHVVDSTLYKLNASWTDHSLLSTTCCLGVSPSGPGLWRGNPLLARKPDYQRHLQQHLDVILPKMPTQWNPQKKWDHVKQQVKNITRSFAVDYTNWRKTTIRRLQSERNKFLRSKPPLEVRLQRLPSLEQQIASLQQELSDVLALKANLRWQESGETSVKYLKNLYRLRTIEQHITALRPDDTTDPIEGIEQMLPIAQQFYQSLYTTDPVDNHHIRSYLDEIRNSPRLTTADNEILLAPITIDEIIQETARVETKISSPGEDGLGYAFLYQLFRYPPLQDLILKVYNQALSSRRFPASWQELRVRLLAKKGDLTNLKNWRPISSINCDAKIYTRILNSRMRQVVPLLNNRCQTGFMPNRFIAENGLVLHMVMEHARRLLAYADDVCVFLSSRDDFFRIQLHLNRYSQVSNAKVNLSKTEAIFLNGIASLPWQNLLLQFQISKWHDRTKAHPLRYLGFPVVQSVSQRQYLEGQLLQSVKTQCGIYSQRNLTLRGRVIVVNTLILSKLRQIRSAIYQFITRGIKPPLRYAMLCQPVTKGGLGLLDPVIQHRCLQVRWLRHLLQADDPSSCSQVYLKDFNRSPDARCNPSTLLNLPLLALFSNIPSNHWLRDRQRTKIQANCFFTYDRSLQRVRPMLQPDNPTHPRLSARLFRDLQNRTVTLNNMTWNLILNISPDPGLIDDTPFLFWLSRSTPWISFHPQEFRQTQLDLLLPCSPSPWSPSKWTQFWSFKMLPEARTWWFRFLYGKLHCQETVARFDPHVTTICKFCYAPVEDLHHLIIDCPFKWSIWQEVLSRFSPYLEFSPDDVRSILQHLSYFDFVDNTKLVILSSYICLFIWRAHWRYIFDNTPFSAQQIVSTILEKL
ncbi:hypothetical protein G6F43_011881 [Rhizopus delemar]|nr:hypothetical protein G6F43_011881 [Rhizopus delemar]